MKRYRWDKKYLYWGVTAFCVIVACILFYMLLSNLGLVGGAINRIVSILSPFIWGLVIAYLIYPLVKIYQKQLFLPLANTVYKNKDKALEKGPKMARALAVLLAEITLLILVAAFIWMIGPQLYQSIVSIVGSSQDYINTIYAWIERLFEDYPAVEEALRTALGAQSQDLLEWATEQFLPQLKGLLGNLSSSVMSLGKSIYNILIGLIVSVYVLYSRETFAAYFKKIIYCIFSLEASQKILDALHFTNEVFLGFISGKILDSAIIGAICYIGCSILKMPYAMLVAVIVGVTNVIPFFGPFIGAIPSALIILMVDPLKCLIFVIFVVLLQQFDGNILGPKILGNSVGINGFWVMFSIILGAGMFGFMGMLLGVPVFVILFTLFKSLVNRKLKRSGLPSETSIYAQLDHIDPQTGECVMHNMSRRRRKNRKPMFGFKKTNQEAGDSRPPVAETKVVDSEETSDEQQP